MLIKVRIKKQYIQDVNNTLKFSFDELPFLFEENKEYEVDSISNSLIITGYDKEREFCIKGLDMSVLQRISFFDLNIVRRRRIYFPEKIFQITHIKIKN